MARQVRSEATRRKILDAAIDVFNEVGYAAADRGTIIERTGMTKGAFYHHFDSMESLASAIIEEGAELVLADLGTMSDSFSPALENILHGTFVTADLFASDKVARTAEQLTLAFGKFNDNAGAAYTSLVGGDDRGGPAGNRRRRHQLKPRPASGQRVHHRRDVWHPDTVPDDVRRRRSIRRLTQMWELLFPAIVTDASLAYYREFLAREALRHVERDDSP